MCHNRIQALKFKATLIFLAVKIPSNDKKRLAIFFYVFEFSGTSNQKVTAMPAKRQQPNTRSVGRVEKLLFE